MSYQALEHDGNGYASIADASQKGLNMGLSDFMIEGRIKLSDLQTNIRCIQKGTGTVFYSLYSVDNGRLRFHLRSLGGVNTTVTSDTNIVDRRWHYVVIIRDHGGNIYIFIEGSSEGTPSADITLNLDNAHDFVVGAVGFTGLTDEVRVWNFGFAGLPADYEAYITWRSQGRNVFLDISEYNGGSWNGYADALLTDLLTNGDMELDANWTARGTPTTEVRSSEQANNGTYSWKIISDATSEGANQDITTVVGKWHEVTGYVYVTAGDAKLGKEDTDGSDQVLTGQATAAAWNEFNVIFKATETTSRIFFQSDATANSTFYVDDMKVYRTGLVARYKFSGNLNDATSNNNHLTEGGSGNTFPGYSLRSKAQKMLLGVG